MSHGPTTMCVSVKNYIHIAPSIFLCPFSVVCMSHELHSHSWVYVSLIHALYSRSCASQSRPTLCLWVTHYIHIAPSILLCWFYALCIRRTRSHRVINYWITGPPTKLVSLIHELWPPKMLGTLSHKLYPQWCLWVTNYIHIPEHMCFWGNVHKYIHISVRVCIYVYMYIYVYISLYIWICMYICIHKYV